jgi:hypothetical protein
MAARAHWFDDEPATAEGTEGENTETESTETASGESSAP